VTAAASAWLARVTSRSACSAGGTVLGGADVAGRIVACSPDLGGCAGADTAYLLLGSGAQFGEFAL
jgi:hypothetical protein